MACLGIVLIAIFGLIVAAIDALATAVLLLPFLTAFEAIKWVVSAIASAVAAGAAAISSLFDLVAVFASFMHSHKVGVIIFIVLIVVCSLLTARKRKTNKERL